MNTYKKYMLIAVAFLISSCTNSAHRSDIESVSVNKKTQSARSNTDTITNSELLKCFKKQGDIVATDISVKKDTLAIVSRGWFFYYPFGKFKRSQDLANINPVLKLAIEHDSAMKINNDTTDLYRLYYEKSFVKFIYQPETGKYEIVSGKIVNPEIALNNATKIGMAKNEFLDKYFTAGADKRLEGVNVVKFISALDGISHYYFFKKDKLSEIEFDTDYQVNKN